MIEENKNDPAASYWLKEQVEIIGKRDLHDHICDVDHLKQILDLFVDETFTDYDRWANEDSTCPLLTKGWGYPEMYKPKRKPIWKVQLAACGGWADLKTSDDDGDGYFVEPMTYADAITHCKWMVDDLEHEVADLRIVSLDTPADCDLY